MTDDDDIFERLQLIRNHAEAVVEGKGVSNLSNMIGHNFRLGEIESAIGIEQLKKLNSFIVSRQYVAKRLDKGLNKLQGLRTPVTMPGCTHAYYMYPLVLDVKSLGVPRSKVVEALLAEGLEGLEEGYANLHLLPMYQNKIAYGSQGFPWTSDICHRDVSYDKGICPVAEELHDVSYFGYAMCLHDLTEDDIDLVIKTFKKVWNNMESLKN